MVCGKFDDCGEEMGIICCFVRTRNKAEEQQRHIFIISENRAFASYLTNDNHIKKYSF
jgi:hypothetical protein